MRQFKKQIAYLVKHHVVVKPSENGTVIPNGSKIVVSITFDDAFKTVLDNAVPVLREFGLPAGIFVPTGHIGSRATWEMEPNCSEVDDIIMDKDDLLVLDQDGYEILSHTVSHPNLTEIGGERAAFELKESKSVLESILGHEVLAISYPYGAYNEGICKAAEKAGYRLGFTVEPDWAENAPNHFLIGRFLVSPTDNLLKFKLKVIGAYRVVKYLRRLKGMIIRSKKTGCR